MKIKNKLKIVLLFLFSLHIGILYVNAASFSVGTIHGTEDTNSLIITDTKTLTVTNVSEDDTLTAYKIIDAFYNPTSNVVYYEFTSDFSAFLSSSLEYRSLTLEVYQKLTSGDITNGSISTESSLDTLVSSYAGYIKENNIVGTDLAKNGTTRTANLPLGSYLVLPKVSNRIYAVMVGNLAITEENSTWVASNATIVAKATNPGIVTKTISGNKETDSSYIDHDITYNITGTVPQYPSNATNKKYMITDTMSSGLTFSGISSMSITDGSTRLNISTNGTVTDSSGNTVANIILNNQTISIDFNLDYIKSTQITLTYKAKLNDSAVVGSSGNTNSAILTYSNDPYGTGTANTDGVSTTMYTYGIEVFKYSGTNKTALLSGVEFELYSNASLTTKLGTLTTNEEGIALFKGLPSGTYYLKETKAPKGYEIPDAAIAVNVANANAEESNNNPGYYRIEISNTKNMFLPFTGGIGTYAYTIIGLSIIVIAVIIFIIYRKRRGNKENDEK